MPNKNMLAGLRCPRCASAEPFDIVVTGWASVYDNKCVDIRNVNWHDTDLCICKKCGYGGVINDFKCSEPMDIPTFETAYISTGHITEEDSHKLNDNAWKEDSEHSDIIISHYAGWIIWVPESSEFFENLGMSDDFMRLLRIVESGGFTMLYLSGGAPLVKGLRKFSW